MRKFIKLTLFIVTISILSPSQAAIITHKHGARETGRIGEITGPGFQFFGERFVVYEYDRIIDIEVDTALTGSELDKDIKAVSRISQLLDKDKKLKAQLGQQVRKWLEQGSYQELENKALGLNQSNARWPTGRWQIYSFYEGLTSDLYTRDVSEHNERLEQVKKWVSQTPKSTTAKISLMKVLIGVAWSHRGGGFANTVTDEGLKKFKDNLSEAIEIGVKLHEEKAADLMLYNYLIRAANAYGAKKSLLIELSKESAKINPEFYLPYIRTLEGLLIKWGGEAGEAEKFSQWAYQLIDDGSPEVVFQTHRALNGQIRNKRYIKMNFDWTTIRRSFENFRNTYHANDADIHLMAKLACLHGDKKSALEYFAQTDESWNYLTKQIWRKQERLNRFKSWASKKDNPRYIKIVESILNENFEVFSSLIDAAKNAKEVFFEKDLFGDTMLHRLANDNSPEFLDKISSVGINLETYNDRGYTALQIAANSGRARNVEILVNNGADIFAKRQNSDNNSAHLAAKKGFTKVLAVLLDKEPGLISSKGVNGSPPIHRAAWNGYTKTVEFLLSKENNQINFQDDYQYTPLHYAVDRGYEEIVNLLIAEGADTSQKNNKGHTALSLARIKGFKNLVDYLVSINAPDSDAVNQSAQFNKANEIYQLSSQYFNKKDYKKAKDVYHKALEAYPDFYLSYAGLAGVALEFERDYIQADKYYDKSIELNPKYAENYYWKGRTNYILGKPEVYTPLFIKYIEMAPDTYNSQDLKKNWSHLLVDGNTSHLTTALASRTFFSRNKSTIIASLAVLILILLLIRFRNKRTP